MPKQTNGRPLRRVTYQVIRKGDRGGITESGDVLSLLFHCPFFFVARLIPPMSVVNDFLVAAAADQSSSGGQCTWEPFQLDAAEYDDLVAALRRRRFKAVASPRWISTHRDWLIWCGEVVWGVPSLKRRRVQERISKLERAIEEHGISDEQIVTRLKELMNLHVKDARYFSEHASRKSKVPLFKPR